MSKSTTGAYGDFPDYYYAAGNQFGAFLLGKTPKPSWDTKMEATLDAGGGPIVFPKSGPPGAHACDKPKANAHDELMVYVRAMLSPVAAARILNVLARARGIRDVPTASNPYLALDRFALQSLNEEQLTTILERMRSIAATPPSQAKKSARSGSRNAPVSDIARRAKPAPSALSSKARPGRQPALTPSACAIPACSKMLSPEERSFWERHRDHFLSQGYCMEHATQLLATLGVSPRPERGHG